MTPPGQELPLRDIHLPDSVAWWSPAPGWWLVLLITGITLALGVLFYRHRRRRRLHKAASLELASIEAAYAQSRDGQTLIRDLSIWLRRVCLSFYPRAEVAGLTGQAWLGFLDQLLIKAKQDRRFSEGAGCALLQAPYQSAAEVDAQAVLLLCRQWLRCLPRHGRPR